uniref:Uncharacterized protein n=1 Tax=Anguilla anguilla TaxID=7936 RepID=A0A0E9QH84_ANGAN
MVPKFLIITQSQNICNMVPRAMALAEFS